MSFPPPFKRPSFWFGLLLGGLASFGGLTSFGGLASFGARRYRPSPQPRTLDPLFDLVSDAVVFCDASGAVTGVNAAAHALFGPDALGLARLRYPSGQRVPPGQSPLNRALRTGKAVEGMGYLCVSAEGKTCPLDIKARLLPGGGAALIARDRTEAGDGLARETKAQKRETALRALCRRLSAAPDAEATGQALVESALALAEGIPGARVRLYTYNSDAKRLTRQASAPEDRPKRPKSHRQAQRLTFPFDASAPLLWSVYIARQPALGTDVGEDSEHPAYALPLLLGGVAIGHLSLTCLDADGLADADLRETLELFASAAALALSGPHQAAQAVPLVVQMEALHSIIRAGSEGAELGILADLVSSAVCRVTGAEVCTLVVREGDRMRLVGAAYRDALLFPDRYASDDPALVGDAAREAIQKGKTTQWIGLANPHFEAGIWRAFAGQSGRHSVLSAPLAAGQGALTVYMPGDAPVAAAQVKFLETMAMLMPASQPEASQPAGHTAL